MSCWEADAILGRARYTHGVALAKEAGRVRNIDAKLSIRKGAFDIFSADCASLYLSFFFLLFFCSSFIFCSSRFARSLASENEFRREQSQDSGPMINNEGKNKSGEITKKIVESSARLKINYALIHLSRWVDRSS